MSFTVQEARAAFNVEVFALTPHHVGGPKIHSKKACTKQRWRPNIVGDARDLNAFRW